MAELGIPVRGIGYDAGVLYERDFESHPGWTPEIARRDMRAIRDRLGCTHVLIMATDADRLLATARIAREERLGVWLQPRVFDVSRDDVAKNLAIVAARGEELRAEFGDVSLNVGRELSLSVNGFLPGPTFATRGMLLPLTFVLLPLANRRLRAFLRHLTTVAREHFTGPIGYGSGDWERPDWSLFDIVGLDAYRDGANRSTFANEISQTVRAQHAAGRPVYIFEFGTTAFRGSSARAAQAAFVLRSRGGRLAVPQRLVRDEDEQARYLDELLDLFESAGVDGAFVWGFAEPALIRSDAPGRDLDLASYGVVAAHDGGEWSPKTAFTTLAQRYGGQG